MTNLTKTLILFSCFQFSLTFGQCDSLFFNVHQTKPVNSSDIVLHYSFENNSNDFSGNGNDAVVFTGDYIEGKCGKAARFLGNDFIEIPDNARFTPLQSSSVAFWMKTTQTSRFDLIDQRTGDWSVNNHNFGLYFNCCPSTRNIHYNYPNYNTASQKTTLNVISNEFNDNQWHLMVLVKDVSNQTMSIFQDGCLIASRTINDINFIINGTLFIGKHFSNIYYYSGLLDEFRIYNRVLDSVDIELLMRECTPLDVEVTKDCKVCIDYPQHNMTYHLQDTTGNVLDSYINTCDNRFCFSTISNGTPLNIKVETPYSSCSMILDTTIIQCLDTDTACTPHILMPDVFTPNNDGINDFFTPVKIDCVIPKQLTIFNRWGQELFSSDKFFQWDGRAKSGNFVADGVYYWILEAEDLDSNYIHKTGFTHIFSHK